MIQRIKRTINWMNYHLGGLRGADAFFRQKINRAKVFCACGHEAKKVGETGAYCKNPGHHELIQTKT